MPELMQNTTSGACSRAEPATHAAAPPALKSECSMQRTARSRGGGGGGGGPMLGCPTSPPPSEVEAPLAHLRAAENELEPVLPGRPPQPADGLREEAASRELSLHSLASAHHPDKHAPVGAAAAAAGRVGPGALGQLAPSQTQMSPPSSAARATAPSARRPTARRPTTPQRPPSSLPAAAASLPALWRLRRASGASASSRPVPLPVVVRHRTVAHLLKRLFADLRRRCS